VEVVAVQTVVRLRLELTAVRVAVVQPITQPVMLVERAFLGKVSQVRQATALQEQAAKAAAQHRQALVAPQVAQDIQLLFHKHKQLILRVAMVAQTAQVRLLLVQPTQE
jgi:microcompartment protein CcmL/EutN